MYIPVFKLIKMSSSKSWPRKEELTHVYKNATITMSILHITMELVKHITPLQNNFTTLIYSLVNGLYKITTEFINLILDVE